MLSSIEDLIKERGLSEIEVKALIETIKHSKPTGQVHKHNWSSKHAKIGVGSDIHMGSRFTDFGDMNDLFKRFKKEGVDAVYLAGDMTEGYNMRPGHSLEVNMHGADEQVKGVVEHVPNIGKPIYFICGNHDHSHFKSAGVDIGKMIDKDRKDMHYLGFNSAKVVLGDNTVMELVHPGKGSAYAVSYNPQKMIESYSSEGKPNILVIGHYHKAEYLYYRAVHAIQAGCLQNQSDFMKLNNLSAHKCGWILDVWMKRNGHLDRIDMKMFPYY